RLCGVALPDLLNRARFDFGRRGLIEELREKILLASVSSRIPRRFRPQRGRMTKKRDPLARAVKLEGSFERYPVETKRLSRRHLAGDGAEMSVLTIEDLDERLCAVEIVVLGMNDMTFPDDENPRRIVGHEAQDRVPLLLHVELEDVHQI